MVTGPGGSRVVITDVGGRRIRTLVLDPAGRATWDGRDEGGVPAPAGLYFVRLANHAAPSRRIVRLE